MCEFSFFFTSDIKGVSASLPRALAGARAGVRSTTLLKAHKTHILLFCCYGRKIWCLGNKWASNHKYYSVRTSTQDRDSYDTSFLLGISREGTCRPGSFYVAARCFLGGAGSTPFICCARGTHGIVNLIWKFPKTKGLFQAVDMRHILSKARRFARDSSLQTAQRDREHRGLWHGLWQRSGTETFQAASATGMDECG